ncbi:MAG TPA: PQQ-dependent sugar dehydrogenase [Pseudomonas xinjiangensis]|uniref:PQQ-dependent sugar dehydrogenase n=2 Tax=root TaxID=1 RepID=A0A7V1FQM1_9GAMM|nr:PQQ-dependent sugar dehydrogenase [Halopseudomonas xinjiangensis]HEC47790.1 PQQ-dependent sugar dehydrogenase [Halopseudomonas xinjiangensis]
MVPFRHSLIFLATLGLLTACDNSSSPGNPDQPPAPTAEVQAAPAEPSSASDQGEVVSPDSDTAFSVTEVTRFEAPWAMTFLPDGRLLVTEMAGNLRLHDLGTGQTGNIEGVPDVVHAGQGGLGDVLLHPQFADNQQIYISYVEAGDGGSGGAVALARLALDENGGGELEDLRVIWRQTPKMSGDGHFGLRLAFDNEGMLWISSSERQEFDPAQDMTGNLGKIVRLNDDGSVPDDNPFTDQGEVAAQVWSLGHRNILGMAFDADGRLWAHEMGPEGGDELNLIEKGANYGYPIVSNGVHYDGSPIPDHDTRPEFNAPVITWTPVISPAGFIIYNGELFPEWQGSGFIGGLSFLGLVRVEFDGESAGDVERFDLQRRIREVEQGPDGAIWVLEDGRRGGNGTLLKLTPQE